MAIAPIKAPVAGASFQSLLNTDATGKPEERVLVKLAQADVLRVSTRQDALSLQELQKGGSRRPQISAHLFKKFLETIG